MKTDAMLLIQAVVSVLQIQKPVDVVLKTKVSKKRQRGLAGWCDTVFHNGRLVKHSIKINLGQTIESEYDLCGVIAHELIHAKMLEEGTFNPEFHHDERFQIIAFHLEDVLDALGFNTGALYDSLTDTD